MTRRIEHAFPFAVAALAGFAALPAALCDVLPEERVPAYLPAGTITLGLIVAGFTATQRNMLLGMGGSKVLRFAAKTGYYRDVLAYLARCIYAGLALTVVSMARPLAEGYWPAAAWVALWIASLALMLTQLLLNEILMTRIVKRFIEQENKSS